MVFHHNHSITSSESQTTPPPPPPSTQPPPPPPPPPSPAIRMATSSPAGAFPSRLHQNLTFRWPLLSSSSSSSHLSNNPNRFRYGRLPLPEAGGLNPVLRIGPSPLNPARSSNDINTNRPVAGPVLGPVAGTVVGPVVGPVEGSERKVDEKGKSKLFIRLPMKKRGLGPGYVPSFTETEPEPEPEAEAEAEAESEPEAEVEREGDDGDVGVKTWNLRPRRPAVAKAKGVPEGGGGGSVQRRRNGNGSGRRNRGGNNKGKEKVNNKKKKEEKGEKGRGKVLSLALTKEEIEEDFLKMTGSKPPKKPKRRSKALQKHLDVATFPGLWLNGMTPDMYRIPDPPLKG